MLMFLSKNRKHERRLLQETDQSDFELPLRFTRLRSLIAFTLKALD